MGNIFINIITVIGALVTLFLAAVAVSAYKEEYKIKKEKSGLIFCIIITLICGSITYKVYSWKKVEEPEKTVVSEKKEETKETEYNFKVEEKKEIKKVEQIIGSTKEELVELFKEWKHNTNYTKNVDKMAIKFENENLLVVIYFDKNWIAEGVSFLSTGKSENYGDLITGKGSYVDKNYKKIVKFATGGKKVKVENNPGTEYPVEVHIGKIHD